MNMKYIYIFRKISLLLMFFLIFSACDKFSDNAPANYKESVKGLNGTWKIIKALRNGTDITSMFDFSKFRLNFNSDNTYLVENYIPFIVKSSGTWSLDDPRYPYNLVFKEYGSQEDLTTGFSYPIVDGKRQISLSFSPGCHSNIYTYIFEEVPN